MCPERREKLIHQSDFTSEESKHWVEAAGALTRSFRRDGYFYVGAHITGAIRTVRIPVVDFKASVDVQFTDSSDKDALCGIVFRAAQVDGNWDKFYCFGVQGIGACALLMQEADKWIEIVGYKRSDFINKKTGTNSLMVEMVGQEITGAVNGHVLVRATDRRLGRGDVGVIVNSTKGYLKVCQMAERYLAYIGAQPAYYNELGYAYWNLKRLKEAYQAFVKGEETAKKALASPNLPQDARSMYTELQTEFHQNAEKLKSHA